MFFIFPAHGSQQLFLFMPPAGAFLSIAKERSTVVSVGFQPFARRENRETSSKPPCCIRHRRRFGILFVAVDKKYAAGGKQETTGGKSGLLEARSLQEKITRWSEKENLQGGNGFPRPACGLVSE